MGVTTRKQNENVTTTIEKVFEGNNNIVVEKTAVRISPPRSPKAHQEISDLETTLDKLAGLIAEQCPESDTKKDLLAYLKRIELYCQQLNITSKVRADEVPEISEFQEISEFSRNSAPPVISTTEGSVTRSSETRGSGVTADPTVPDNNGLQPIPEQPSNEKAVTICTGELKAFFPVTCDHIAVINGTYYAHLDYDEYYETAEHLILNNKYPLLAQQANVPLGKELKSLNIAKRGAVVYACPYCGQPSKPGDKQTVVRHMNEREVSGKK